MFIFDLLFCFHDSLDRPSLLIKFDLFPLLARRALPSCADYRETRDFAEGNDPGELFFCPLDSAFDARSIKPLKCISVECNLPFVVRILVHIDSPSGVLRADDARWKKSGVSLP